MKQIITWVMVLVMIVSLCGCFFVEREGDGRHDGYERHERHERDRDYNKY